MPGICVVTTTVTSAAEAKSLAESILDARLGACVQRTNILSCYEWEGKLCEEPEILLQIKTTTEAADRLISFIAKRHPYKVPEIIALPVNAALSSYTEWVMRQVERVE